MPRRRGKKFQAKQVKSEQAAIVKHSNVFIPYHRLPHSDLPFDPIFFRKQDIRQNAILLHQGRMAAGTRWRVTNILSDMGYGHGSKKVKTVARMNDVVTLLCIDNPTIEPRDMSFGYLSYSAIWRLTDADAEAIVAAEDAKTAKAGKKSR